MKVWRKLYTKGRIVITLPVTYFMYCGFDPKKRYRYKVEFIPEEKAFKIIFKNV